ncbi:ABC transporter permease [Sciscionella sediminilitoris]|uniref:ABC transporter permease n=1 Tax=Sciscionella sediminilitoris TaxID=1445613 RepID=UPI0004DF45DD|nr:ABC transporter permease [Sciscionella sp. SE31]
MTLMAVERIKLVTTRAPWLCAILALALTVGLAGVYALQADHEVTIAGSQLGISFGLIVVMVLATLSVTTEYRTGTIRTTFQAAPSRIKVLGAKAATVAIIAGVVGELYSFASFGVGQLLAKSGAAPLSTADDWRQVAGAGLLYAAGAILAVAVGILIRHTAGALALLLVYTLMGENLIQIIPNVGEDIHPWMPFHVGQKFLTGSGGEMAFFSTGDVTLSPWASLAYFAAFAVVLLAIALGVAKKRDA